MGDVASLELCKALFELSGWDGTHFVWYKKPNIIWVGVSHVIWFFLKPIVNWLDKHDRSNEDD